MNTPLTMQSFVKSMIPKTIIYKKKIEKIEKQLKNGIPTIPSTLKEELECNIFLRAKDVESFSKLRDLKDNF